MATDVRLRCMVRVRRRSQVTVGHTIAHRHGSRHRHAGFCVLDRDDLAVPGPEAVRAAVAAPGALSDEQVKYGSTAYRSFPRRTGSDRAISSTQLGRTLLDGAAPVYPVRTAFASDLLLRRPVVVRRPLVPCSGCGRRPRPDTCQCRRHHAHGWGGLVDGLVQEPSGTL